MRSLTTLDLQAIGELRARGEFFWLDLHTDDPTVADDLGRTFGFAELAVEDSREFGQRPKADDYGDHALVVFYGMDDQELVEVHVYVSGEVVVTLRRASCRTLSVARERLASVDARSEEEAIYRVLDALTDSFVPALRTTAEEIEHLQDLALESAHRDIRARILVLRRRLAAVRRVIGPQRDMFAQAAPLLDRLPGLSGDEAHDYFRDINDHLIRLAEHLDANRDQLANALDLHSSAVSERANQVTERLTLISTIFLPLTFITGFFGQNFGWMVDGVNTRGDFLVFGVGGLLVSVVLLVVYFVRSGFFED